MRKSELRRKSPIKKSGKPIRKKNRDRAKKRFDGAFGEKASWVRSLSCEAGFAEVWGGVMLTCRGAVEAAHVKSRGAGGTSKHLIPLCTAHHAESHTIGIKTFQAKYGINLEALAAEYEARWTTLTKEELEG